MIFIRTLDNITLQKLINNKYIKNIEFNFINKRINNNILQFKINNNNIEYFYDFLVIKKIPKKLNNILFQKPITCITTQDSQLIYQDFDNRPIKFLTYDEITDKISMIDIADIVPDETEILCYDNISNDYYITIIKSISQYIYNLNNNDINDENYFYNNIYFEKFNELSDYIIHSEHGIIINNFLLFS